MLSQTLFSVNRTFISLRRSVGKDKTQQRSTFEDAARLLFSLPGRKELTQAHIRAASLTLSSDTYKTLLRLCLQYIYAKESVRKNFNMHSHDSRGGGGGGLKLSLFHMYRQETHLSIQLSIYQPLKMLILLIKHEQGFRLVHVLRHALSTTSSQHTVCLSEVVWREEPGFTLYGRRTCDS